MLLKHLQVATDMLAVLGDALSFPTVSETRFLMPLKTEHFSTPFIKARVQNPLDQQQG